MLARSFWSPKRNPSRGLMSNHHPLTGRQRASQLEHKVSELTGSPRNPEVDDSCEPRIDGVVHRMGHQTGYCHG